uniref:HMG box domain-containing protein n=1 Tax=Chaetoceros debilis TaxID=122233 RepID=A0A6S8SKV7_9STRA|mmetsp:Transcript_20589/g.30370  ORF Transcript_20589/g.30370 Transcript_20589/m.30370 type:complete len:226 (+) Transcript_20589:334-1011(+)
MVKRMPSRDPGAPKRNLSAYLLFQNAMRETFKAQNPGMTFGQLSKYTSSMYAALTPEDKGVWQGRASQDKSRYLMEMATYIPSPAYDAKGDRIGGNSIPYEGPQKSSARDPNAPKRNLSTYLLYQNSMRETFKAENPAISFGDLAKLTSKRYKGLSAEERAAWDERSRLDKQRYNIEIKNYCPPSGYDATGKRIEEKKAGPAKKQKVPRDPSQPKRARGSFVRNF